MRIEFIHKKVVRKINNLSILSSNEDFLKRLLTFRSYDKVQSALKEKGIDISLGNIDKIKKIVYDAKSRCNLEFMDGLHLTTTRIHPPKLQKIEIMQSFIVKRNAYNESECNGVLMEMK